VATDAGKESEAPSVPSGISAFVAKVLDQLSLTAWLPAMLFAATVTLFGQFRSQRSLAVGKALGAITSDVRQVLILLVPVLLLATMLTQAFSYGAIRTLEGYWRRNWLCGWLRTGMTRYQVHRWEKLGERRAKAADRAVSKVRRRLRDAGYSSAVIDALATQATGGPQPALLADDQIEFDGTSWREQCNAWDIARVDQIDRQIDDYPAHPGRILPMKLGNVLRASEDQLENTEKKLEGFVLRHRAILPLRLQTQHDQFRDRLDMYCMLVFVSVASGGVAAALVSGRIAVWQVVTIVAAYLVFGFVCYHSAIASGRGYGSALKEIDAFVGKYRASAGPPVRAPSGGGASGT
jgi:hypothetical protein